MINHFSLTLSTHKKSSEKLTGYQIYACLLSMLKDETAEQLHQNVRSPISQSILSSPKENVLNWEISVFDESLTDEIANALAKNKEFYSHKTDTILQIDSVQQETIKDFFDIHRRSSSLSEHRNIEVSFKTTTALKKTVSFCYFLILN